MPIPNKHWPTYPRVTWRSVSPVIDGEIAISFETEDGSALRFRVSVDSAESAARSILRFEEDHRLGTNVQSPRSSGNPSLPGSNPAEGHGQ